MTVYITGVSRGLGEALARECLHSGFKVVGIGRNSSIAHPNYTFIQVDLSNINAINEFAFTIDNAGCVLINNAGTIGSIRRISDQEESDIAEVMTVNATMPMLLCQKFLKEIPPNIATTILNISSGASTRPIPSWAAYCASKAALDRFSETLYMEELEKKRNVRIYSISPGVIDTPMQALIRSVPAKDFSGSETFKGLKESSQLQSPASVAQKLLRLFEMPFDGRVIRSLKEMD